MTDTAGRVRAIMVEHLGIGEADVQPDALLVPDHDIAGRRLRSGKPDLGCDSLDVVELVMAFEEEFRIEIPDDEAEQLNTGTVQNCYDLIAAKVAARAA